MEQDQTLGLGAPTKQSAAEALTQPTAERPQRQKRGTVVAKVTLHGAAGVRVAPGGTLDLPIKEAEGLVARGLAAWP